MNFSEYVYSTCYYIYLNASYTVCCLVVGLGLGLGLIELDLVSLVSGYGHVFTGWPKKLAHFLYAL